MAADSVFFISHKLSGTIPDHRELASVMIADELWYMKTRLYFISFHIHFESICLGYKFSLNAVLQLAL